MSYRRHLGQDTTTAPAADSEALKERLRSELERAQAKIEPELQTAVTRTQEAATELRRAVEEQQQPTLALPMVALVGGAAAGAIISKRRLVGAVVGGAIGLGLERILR